MADRPFIVAIDGPAGAGKSTVAREVARRTGALYVDTGAMYRAVALWALRNGTPLENMESLAQLAAHADIRLSGNPPRIFLNGEDVTDAIRQPEVAQGASIVAANPAVRRAMVALQRDIAAEQSIVMEGRDIGSVVFPDAEVKIYLDAQPEVRATRRAAELSAKGQTIAFDALCQQITERDHRDRTREISPLLQAPDAEYIDSSQLSTEEVIEAILALVRKKTSNGKLWTTS
ncbi:MAG: (d)CMP kinase [Bryobacter sp.]|nr:(d)CMP kinase [Bryobacter sp.]